MKKLISVLIAAAIVMGMSLNSFAISDDFYSTETESIASALAQVSDDERNEFINENLDIRLQDMSVLVTLTANQNYDRIDEAVAKAIDDGLTAVEIKEAIYQAAPYCGYARAINAMDAADAALTALGVDLPNESRITSTEEERYSDGLAVQRHIFGPQIGTITDDMTLSQKLQTLYLSGICFGDFYNRAGLSLNTREFLTFCTIAANGDCESQVGSHTTGNLNVGHSTDMLRAALLLNEEYNGAEKTAAALSAVNSVKGEPAEGVAEPEIAETIDVDYSTDSQELADIVSHYETDDEDGYLSANLDAQTQDVIIEAINAYIDGTDAVTSDNASLQSLIDLMLLGAEGGRETDIPAAVSANLAAGNTADTMLASALLCTPYNGFPITLNLMSAINSALADNANAEQEPIVIAMQIGSPEMTVNGDIIEIDPGRGTVPVLVSDRTLLPVRAVIEALGGTVEWNDADATATLAYGEDVIQLTIGSTTAYLNGAAQTLDVAPVLIDDRTMLPIRFIAESFGFNVGWYEDTQTVSISNSAGSTNLNEPAATNEDESEESRALVVYFSATGNTEAVAETIASVTGADVYEIIPEIPYTSEDLNYNDDNSRANQEMNDENARPAISGGIENIDDYDTIFLGYPIWWGTMPRIINTFLDTYDLSGKTILPFCTSGSSGISSSVERIRNICPNSDVKDGMRGTSSTDAAQIQEWIASAGLEIE